MGIRDRQHMHPKIFFYFSILSNEDRTFASKKSNKKIDKLKTHQKIEDDNPRQFDQV